MGYKTIVVYLNNSVRNPHCLEFAINLALKYKAHLKGVYAVHELPYLFVTPYSGYEMLEEVKRQMEEARNQSKNLFDEAVRKAGISAEWCAIQGDLQESILLYTCTADLAVVMQRDSDDIEGYTPREFQELVLLSGGRPTLFLPPRSLPTAFDNITIAWNGTRESARAVADAHPLLLQAKNIVVLIAETKANKSSTHQFADAALIAYLSRHDIKAELIRSTMDESEIGGWLLSKTAYDSADLLVSGAYGHSHAYEMVWGGVTRSLLRSMNTPVLMSH